MTDRIQSLLKGFGELFFLPGALNGLILLGIALLNPRIAIAGVIAVLSAWGLAKLMDMEPIFLQHSYYIYNPFLVGCSLGIRFELSPLAIGLTIIAGLLTFIITLLLASLFVDRIRLPLLSLPFSLTSAALYLVVNRYAHSLTAAGNDSVVQSVDQFLQSGDWGVPYWIAGFFQSLGAILFVPSLTIGLLVAALILGTSRVMFGLAIAGYFTGVITRGLLYGSVEEAFLRGDNFNFLLIAMALGGGFLVPSLTSCLLALIAVAITPLVLDLFLAAAVSTGVPLFTIPFCAIVCTAIVALRLSNYSGLFVGIGKTPEEVRENAIVAKLRYPGSIRSLFLPFSGQWTVWQGFNGRWTHQGIWRFAYDFVITGSDGKTHRGLGTQLSDYLCFRMPVLSPVRGRIIRVVDHLIDNPVGTVGGGSNWGNLMVIEDPRGFYVELSHFSTKTAKVKEGDWVERGTVLGLCGNSGNSPQPHIHVQVQATENVGAATLSFSFVNYQHDGVFHSNDLPVENAQIKPLQVDKQFDDLTNFVLDEELTYDVFQQGRPVDHVRLKVRLAPDGTYYFETEQGKLYFGKYDGTYYFYRVDGDDPYLKRLFLASPRIPLAYRNQMSWTDYVPASVAVSGVRRFASRLGAILFPKLARVKVVQTFMSHNRIESVVESPFTSEKMTSQVEFDEQCGIASVTQGDWEIRRAIAPDGGAISPATLIRRSPQPWYQAIAAGLLCLVTFVGVLGADRNPAEEAIIRKSIQQSVESEKSKSYAKGIEALVADYASHSNHYHVNARLGWLHYLNADYVSAEKYYQVATRMAPKSVEALQGVLLSQLAQLKYADAESSAKKLLSLDSGNYYGRLRLEYALRMQQKYKEAGDVLQQLVAAYPADMSISTDIAALKVTPEGAAITVKIAETLDAKAETAWQASVTAEANGNYSEGIKPLADLSKTHGKSYLFNVRLGWLSYTSGDYKASETYYDQAIKTSPAAIEAKLGRLSPLLAQAKYDLVETQAAAIVGADSLNYYGNYWRAYALLQQPTKIKQAAPILERLLAAYPSDVNVMLNLAFIRIKDNQKAAAKDLLQQALSLDPSNAYATKTLKDL